MIFLAQMECFIAFVTSEEIFLATFYLQKRKGPFHHSGNYKCPVFASELKDYCSIFMEQLITTCCDIISQLSCLWQIVLETVSVPKRCRSVFDNLTKLIACHFKAKKEKKIENVLWPRWIFILTTTSIWKK